ncbi:MAG TPA: cysteine desulfurase [Vicinamibacterales bacterium]|nr:cysteine desulfurase [Vicinamibacterales bacterium]
MLRTSTYDVAAIRAEFPALDQRVHGRPLVYLDNAATAQKPHAVLEAIQRYYEHDNANVHRGVHVLSERATAAYEEAREITRAFLNAASTREIIFTRNATESINLVARAWGDANVRKGDEVLVTVMEHHSNIVPWQLLCERTGATLVAAPISDRGELLMDEFERRLTPRTKMVAVVHQSNALGTINPVAQIVALARRAGAAVLIDGSQAVVHQPVDVQALGADFYVLTGHKLYGPTGIGVLHGREAVLDAMPPFLGGGDMIRTVTVEKSTWNDLPYKFEAGTPHIAGAIGLGAAIRYVTEVGLDAIAAHENALMREATSALEALPGVRIIGTAREKASVISFVMDGIHPHDIGTVVDREGVAVRTGHHCAQPVMDRFGIPATARASFAMYNTREDVAALVAAVERARTLLG